jgi:hypothetical protein
VSESNFEDVKYLKKSDQHNEVQSKNLKDLELEYSSSNDPSEDEDLKRSYRFLKQYLTLNRLELFFADKAIFIEGDTERVILPAMMKKIDQDNHCDDGLGLLSQNISIVEVGAYSQTFEKFIDFIGIKSLIITDIDSFYNESEFEDDGVTHKLYGNGKIKVKEIKCPASDKKAMKSSNASLDFFFKQKSLKFYKELSFEGKSLSKSSAEGWKQDADGLLKVIYQVEENGYHARSYEDAFFNINKSILKAGHNAFPSLTKKYLDRYLSGNIDDFEFSEKAVNSKPSLAIEILLNSEVSDSGIEFSNWEVPLYIKEGLVWLR